MSSGIFVVPFLTALFVILVFHRILVFNVSRRTVSFLRIKRKIVKSLFNAVVLASGEGIE